MTEVPGLAQSFDKRGAILRGALAAFAERGVHAVPVPEIAARAGVGTGTIYRYFDSKEHLVNELFREKKRELRDRLRRAVDKKAEPYAAFTAFWGCLVAFAREEPESYRFLELQDHLAYLDSASRAVERQVLAPVRSELARLQARGVLRRDLRPEVIMSLIWGAFVGLFKAERSGYIALEATDIATACDACWHMCADGSGEARRKPAVAHRTRGMRSN